MTAILFFSSDIFHFSSFYTLSGQFSPSRLHWNRTIMHSRLFTHQTLHDLKLLATIVGLMVFIHNHHLDLARQTVNTDADGKMLSILSMNARPLFNKISDLELLLTSSELRTWPAIYRMPIMQTTF